MSVTNQASVTEAGMPEGTTIQVEDLFYTLPAAPGSAPHARRLTSTGRAQG